MHQGWISLHRKIQDHPLFLEKRSFSKFEAWIDLLLLANHKDNKVLLGNEYIVVERGSFITSELKLMDRWGWSKTKVRSFLKLLEEDSMIVKKTDKKKTTLTICHYSDYQNSETTKEPQKNHKETTKEPQKDTNNNVNNDNNENNDNKKDINHKQAYDESSIYFQLANFLFQRILENNPEHKKPNLQKWANTVRLMMERDKRTEEQIKFLINWSQNDSFWQGNILSMDKLRDQFDRLVVQCKRDKQNKPSRGYQRQEIVPDWLKNQNNSTPTEEHNPDFEAEAEALMKELQEKY
ncbi:MULTISPECIES: hypothetical protein [Bacillus]|uniref:hypothetical protein n=1 Tax=Bacillus TaxID=1386 RepID=UPI0002D36EBA|nr:MULTISPECIES: hypothetical protein [Bacillus]